MKIPEEVIQEIYTYAKLVKRDDAEEFKENVESFLEQMVHDGRIDQYSCNFSGFLMSSATASIQSIFEIYVSGGGHDIWEDIIMIRVDPAWLS